MAAKLEWVHSLNDGDEWHADRWVIRVARLTGFFYAVPMDDRKKTFGNWPTLKEAAAWCEQQDREAAPPAELPQPGDVWGVQGKRETRRFVVSHTGDGVVTYADLEDEYQVGERVWQSWVRDTGAVRIDGEGERKELLDKCRAADWEIEQVLGRALGYPRYADDPKNFPGATGDEVCVGEHVAVTLAGEVAARVRELEAENAELRARCEKAGQTTHWSLRDRAETAERRCQELEGEVARLRKEHEAVQEERNRLREWKASVSNAIQNAPEFAAGEWGGNKDGWGYHFEVVQYLIRNRDELRTKVGLMEEEAEAGRGTPLKGAAYVRVGRAAGRAEMRERAETAEKERDDARAECARLAGNALVAVEEAREARAAVGRLMEALRGIEGTTIYCRDNPLVKLAREAIKREEGVKS